MELSGQMHRKTLVIIGYVLMALIFVSLVAVAVIATLEGEGAVPFKPVPGGRGGVLFPVLVLPLGLAAVVVAVLWLRRRLLRSKRVGGVYDKTPNHGVQRTGQTAARR